MLRCLSLGGLCIARSPPSVTHLPTWLFTCSWHYSSVRVSPPRACGSGCHGYQALCITVMSTDSLLKCHWTRNGCCNPSKPRLALDGHCFEWFHVCACDVTLSVSPLSLNRCVCVCVCVNGLFHIKLSVEWWAMISTCMPVIFNWSFNYITTHAVHCLFHLLSFLSVILFFFFTHVYLFKCISFVWRTVQQHGVLRCYLRIKAVI